MIDKLHLRKSSAQQRLALKAAFDRALDLAGGPTSFQYETRVVVGHLAKYSNPHEPLYPPIDVCLDVDLKAREPAVLNALALLEGFSLVRNAPAETEQPWAHEMGDLAKEIGELLAALGAAAADDEVDLQEALTCLKEGYEAKRKLDELIQRLERLARPA